MKIVSIPGSDLDLHLCAVVLNSLFIYICHDGYFRKRWRKSVSIPLPWKQRDSNPTIVRIVLQRTPCDLHHLPCPINIDIDMQFRDMQCIHLFWNEVSGLIRLLSTQLSSCFEGHQRKSQFWIKLNVKLLFWRSKAEKPISRRKAFGKAPRISESVQG